MMLCLWVKLAFLQHGELLMGVFGSREEASRWRRAFMGLITFKFLVLGDNCIGLIFLFF